MKTKIDGNRLGCINATWIETAKNLETGIDFACLNNPRSLGEISAENGAKEGDRLCMGGMLYILGKDTSGWFADYKFMRVK